MQERCAPGLALTDVKDRVLAWACGAQPWWTASEAAKALGAMEDEVRAAFGELEDEGLIYRAVAVRDAYCITADGRDAEADEGEVQG